MVVRLDMGDRDEESLLQNITLVGEANIGRIENIQSHSKSFYELQISLDQYFLSQDRTKTQACHKDNKVLQALLKSFWNPNHPPTLCYKSGGSGDWEQKEWKRLVDLISRECGDSLLKEIGIVPYFYQFSQKLDTTTCQVLLRLQNLQNETIFIDSNRRVYTNMVNDWTQHNKVGVGTVFYPEGGFMMLDQEGGVILTKCKTQGWINLAIQGVTCLASIAALIILVIVITSEHTPLWLTIGGYAAILAVHIVIMSRAVVDRRKHKQGWFG